MVLKTKPTFYEIIYHPGHIDAFYPGNIVNAYRHLITMDYPHENVQ